MYSFWDFRFLIPLLCGNPEVYTPFNKMSPRGVAYALRRTYSATSAASHCDGYQDITRKCDAPIFTSLYSVATTTVVD
jgi:hypothetical protein